uniref:iron-sulfur cluster assembly scaffold protein n=1 Tax=Altererythrobacter segetis TaxID=1104773 RepID=UPI00140B5A08|nr:iron-sulfur cluster assembly scaffold protein [Altererythrobacter segetis]
MAGADKLYTPELLALAVALADYPADRSLPLHGQARSKSCGSTLTVDLALDSEGRIEAIGLQVRACAVGQATAAIFARAAQGRSRDDVDAAFTALSAWLAGSGDPPDWPGLAAIAPARAFPARHGAIMLPWTAARDALSTAGADR